MKNKIIIYIIVPTILSFFAFVSFQKESQNFSNSNQYQNYSCVIELNKNTFAEGEAIWLNVKITYSGIKKDSIALLNKSESMKYVLLKNNKNENATSLDLTIDYIKTPYCVFEPGETKLLVLQLNSNIGFEAPADSNNYFKFLKPDNYTVAFNFSNSMHTIISNKLSFNVTSMNKEAVETLNEFQKMAYTYQASNSVENIEKIQNAIEKYKNTIYEQEFLVFLLRFSQYSTNITSRLNESFLEKIEEQIAKLPDSYNNLVLISRYQTIAKRVLMQPEKFNSFMIRIANNYHSEKMKLFIDVVNNKSYIIK